MEIVDAIVKWVVAPVAAFVWLIYTRQQDHHTEIAVLKSQISSDKVTHDKEMKEMRDTVQNIYVKLDSIEQFLRK